MISENLDFRGVVVEVDDLELNPNKVLVIRYDMKNVGLRELAYIVEYFTDKFPNNTVFALPNSVGLERCDKDELESIVEAINEIIERL